MPVAHDADFPHFVPAVSDLIWKENWVIEGLDVDESVAVMFHFSMRPADGEGIFTAKAQGPDVRIRSVNRHPIGATLDDMRPLTDGSTTFEVLEPKKRFGLRHDGGDGTMDLVFTGRFEPFDFADGPKPAGTSPLGPIGLSVFPFNHYEQSLAFEGTITPKKGPRAGETIAISGLGMRDHSWGWRNDFCFRKHHWLCANFADRYVQGSAMLEAFYPDEKFGGFVSTAAGNDPVAHVVADDPYWLDDPEEPFGSFARDARYTVTTVAGTTHVITAHLSDAFAKLYLNARSGDRTMVYQDCVIFCRFTDETTGEAGNGLLEVGKYAQGPGIADRMGRR